MPAYFDFKKKKKALEVIQTCYECAELAGIRDALFVNFGLLLGIIREGDFIGHDNDVDMCVFLDKITPRQQLNYYRFLEERELFAARKRMSFIKDGEGFYKSEIHGGPPGGPLVKFAWFSLRKRPDYPKFCHWFFFAWNGYYWHTKSGLWVRTTKFNQTKIRYSMDDDALMKGVPENYLSELMPIKFHGLDINIPVKFGSVLDWCYPGWLIPRRGGASSKNVVAVVKEWGNKKTWRICE